MGQPKKKIVDQQETEEVVYIHCRFEFRERQSLAVAYLQASDNQDDKTEGVHPMAYSHRQ
jgi:hypothetical protein